MGKENESTDEFADFVASGEVEVGESNLASDQDGDGDVTEKDKKPAAKRGPPKTKETPKPAAAGEAEGDDDDAGEGEGDGEAEGDDDGEGEEKPKKSAREHQIDRLKREKAQLRRELATARAGSDPDLVRRLENIEKGLSGGNSGDTKTAGAVEPDPSDTDKYPLGHLDDRYIEDKLEWLADRKATERADAVLQRQQENEQHQTMREAQTALLDKVDELATKGTELFEDFQESVVEAGMRGDWDLSQTTFEAAHDAEHGAQILYDLSQDPREARRVAKLSPFQQLKFVQERDAEIGSGKRGRTKPGAGEPPKNQARGANSKTQISPATDNLNDFEKAWTQDAKKSDL